MQVWSAPLRVLHWVLVLAVTGGWLTTFWFGFAHQPAGYIALAAVLARCAIGFWGRGAARFASFVRGPRATLAYTRLVASGRAPRHLGHNPLGGWMALALMACVAGLALTGWLYTTDRFWGDETVDTIHQWLAWSLLGLVLLHVAGALFTGWRHRENLPLAMLTGAKRPAGPGDIPA